MRGLFSIDGPAMRFFLTLKDFVILNFLWMLCCIPVITIGASTSALYYVTFQMVDDKENYVAKQFFKAFKENLKNGILAELILVIPILFFSFSLFFWYSFESVLGTIISVLCIVLLIVLVGALLFVFPLMARYYNPLKQTLKNAVYFCTQHKLHTLLLILFTAAEGALLVVSAPSAILMFLFGFSFINYVCSQILTNLFQRYDSSQTPSD